MKKEIGHRQSEFFNLVENSIKFTKILKSIDIASMDDSLYILYTPSVVYNDLIIANKDYIDDEDNISFILQLPNESDLQDDSMFYYLVQQAVKNIINSIIKGGRLEHDKSEEYDTIVGIDPGNNGAIAFYFKDNIDNNIIFDMPTKDDLSYKKGKHKTVDGEALASILIRNLQGKKAYINVELVHSMPKQGVVSTFSFGKGFGVVLGVIEALGLLYKTVEPREWKKACGIKSKEESVQLAESYFPNVGFYTKRGRLLDGRGDAACLTLYENYERDI